MKLSEKTVRILLTSICISPCINAFANWSSPVYEYERTSISNASSGYGSGSSVPTEGINNNGASMTWNAPSTMPAYGGASPHAYGKVTAKFTWSGGAVPATVQYRGKATGSVEQTNNSGGTSGASVYATPAGMSFNLATTPNTSDYSYTSSYFTFTTGGANIIEFEFELKSDAGGGTNQTNGSASASASVSGVIELG